MTKGHPRRQRSSRRQGTSDARAHHGGARERGITALAFVRISTRGRPGATRGATEIVADQGRRRSRRLSLKRCGRWDVPSEKKRIAQQRVGRCPGMTIGATPTSKLGLKRHHCFEHVVLEEDGDGVDKHDEIRPVELVRTRRDEHGITKGVSSSHPRGRRVNGTGTFRRSERTVGLEDQRSGRGNVPSDELLQVINRLA